MWVVHLLVELTLGKLDNTHRSVILQQKFKWRSSMSRQSKVGFYQKAPSDHEKWVLESVYGPTEFCELTRDRITPEAFFRDPDAVAIVLDRHLDDATEDPSSVMVQTRTNLRCYLVPVGDTSTRSLRERPVRYVPVR